MAIAITLCTSASHFMYLLIILIRLFCCSSLALFIVAYKKQYFAVGSEASVSTHSDHAMSCTPWPAASLLRILDISATFTLASK